jgi:ketosteroid isomerase-like protein
MLREALKSGMLKVASWTIEDVKVSVRGNAAVVTGKSVLTNATYMGQDFSGEYEWTDHFVRQKGGGWRAVSSQSRRVKKQ